VNIIEKWKEIVRNANEKGVPLPMVRADGKASLSATLVFLSFNIWAMSVIGKAAGALGGMDPGACLQMFMVCAGLYFGRKFQKDDKGGVSLGDGKSEAERSAD
jgi:hypothetical protein